MGPSTPAGFLPTMGKPPLLVGYPPRPCPPPWWHIMLLVFAWPWFTLFSPDFRMFTRQTRP